MYVYIHVYVYMYTYTYIYTLNGILFSHKKTYCLCDYTDRP